MPRRHKADPAIVAQSLGVTRGKGEVLKDVTFTIDRGTVTGLLGPNGAGKTTLLRTIVGVQRISTGTLSVLGRPPSAREVRMRVGYATQEPAIYRDLTVTEALRYFAGVLNCPSGRVDQVLGSVGLTDSAGVLIERLSGGQRARANLAVSLLATPDLLVLDEPTVGSDPQLRSELWELFGSLAAKGVTILVSSHVMDEARRCEQLLLIRDGSVLAQDTLDNLRARTGEHDIEDIFLRLTRDGK